MVIKLVETKPLDGLALKYEGFSSLPELDYMLGAQNYRPAPGLSNSITEAVWVWDPFRRSDVLVQPSQYVVQLVDEVLVLGSLEYERRFNGRSGEGVTELTVSHRAGDSSNVTIAASDSGESMEGEGFSGGLQLSLPDV